MREWLLECFPNRGDDRGFGKGACTTHLVERPIDIAIQATKWLDRYPKGVVQVILCDDEGGDDGD